MSLLLASCGPLGAPKCWFYILYRDLGECSLSEKHGAAALGLRKAGVAIIAWLVLSFFIHNMSSLID